MHIIRFIFYKGGSLQGDFSIKPSERVNSLVCISVRIKVNEWINKTTPNTQWSLSVFCSLPPPRPSRPPASPVLQQTARSAFLHARLFLHHTLPLCRTSNDHSTPRGALKFPPPHLSSRPLSPGSLRTGTHDICLSERGRRSWTLCPSVSGSYWPVTPSSTYYSVQGERRREKNESGENERARERERSAENIFMDFRCFIVCARLPHRYM